MISVYCVKHPLILNKWIVYLYLDIKQLKELLNGFPNRQIPKQTIIMITVLCVFIRKRFY